MQKTIFTDCLLRQEFNSFAKDLYLYETNCLTRKLFVLKRSPFIKQKATFLFISNQKYLFAMWWW